MKDFEMKALGINLSFLPLCGSVVGSVRSDLAAEVSGEPVDGAADVSELLLGSQTVDVPAVPQHPSSQRHEHEQSSCLERKHRGVIIKHQKIKHKSDSPAANVSLISNPNMSDCVSFLVPVYTSKSPKSRPFNSTGAKTPTSRAAPPSTSMKTANASASLQ